MGEYWNTALTARMVLETCEEQGVDTGPILRQAEIDHVTVEDPDGRLSLEQMRGLWREAVTQSQDPAIGLHAGGRAPHGLYGIFDYMISYSATIGDAVTRFSDYLPLINNWVMMRVEQQDDRVHAVSEVVWGPVPRPPAEYIAAFLIERSRLIWADAWAPELVRFEFPDPGPSEPRGEHARVLRCPVEFGAPRTEFIISRATWDQPVAPGPTTRPSPDPGAGGQLFGAVGQDSTWSLHQSECRRFNPGDPRTTGDHHVRRHHQDRAQAGRSSGLPGALRQPRARSSRTEQQLARC